MIEIQWVEDRVGRRSLPREPLALGLHVSCRGRGTSQNRLPFPVLDLLPKISREMPTGMTGKNGLAAAGEQHRPGPRGQNSRLQLGPSLTC